VPSDLDSPEAKDVDYGEPLEDFGIDLQGVDLLADYPGLWSVARLRYSNGTRYEYTFCAVCCDVDDLNIGNTLIPDFTLRVGSYVTDTLGACEGHEVTNAFWEPLCMSR
jgi:hypothetical protein